VTTSPVSHDNSVIVEVSHSETDSSGLQHIAVNVQNEKARGLFGDKQMYIE